MIIFESIRIYLTVLGINSPQSNQNHVKNVKHLLILVLFFLSAISSCAVLLVEEIILEEYEHVFTDIVTMSALVFYMAICIWKADTIFKFMLNLEHIIQKSE